MKDLNGNTVEVGTRVWVRPVWRRRRVLGTVLGLRKDGKATVYVRDSGQVIVAASRHMIKDAPARVGWY